MFELSKQFWFEAAHTLDRIINAETSRRVHGHSYRALVTIRGEAGARDGMVMDLDQLALALEGVRNQLDHQMLDDVKGLGPATVENLCAWIWQELAPKLPALVRIAIHRDASGDVCTYYGPQK